MKRFAHWSALLLVLLSAYTAYGMNLVINGDFESGGTGWSEWTSPPGWVADSFAHDYGGDCEIWVPSPYPFSGAGSHCQHVGTDRVHGGLYQVIDVVAGKEYRVSGQWSGGVGGLNEESLLSFSAWFEVVVFHGSVGTDAIVSGVAASTVIAKKESGSLSGDNTFAFGWEPFTGTFIAQENQVTLALKTGQYGYSWDAIAAYHDNIEMHAVTPWPLFVPAMTRRTITE